MEAVSIRTLARLSPDPDVSALGGTKPQAPYRIGPPYPVPGVEGSIGRTASCRRLASAYIGDKGAESAAGIRRISDTSRSKCVSAS